VKELRKALEGFMFRRRESHRHLQPEDVPELIQAADQAREIEASVTLLRARLEGLRATVEGQE
jgi:hypothetical protein